MADWIKTGGAYRSAMGRLRDGAMSTEDLLRRALTSGTENDEFTMGLLSAFVARAMETPRASRPESARATQFLDSLEASRGEDDLMRHGIDKDRIQIMRRAGGSASPLASRTIFSEYAK